MNQGMYKRADTFKLRIVVKAAKINLHLVVEAGEVSLAEVKTRQCCGVASLTLSLEVNKDLGEFTSWQAGSFGFI